MFARKPTVTQLTQIMTDVASKFDSNSWNSPKEFTQFCNTNHIIVKAPNGWYCHCETFAREHICDHVLCLQIYLKEVTVPLEHLQFKHVQKRKRGRPTALIGHRYSRPENSSSDASSDDSDHNSCDDFDDSGQPAARAMSTAIGGPSKPTKEPTELLPAARATSTAIGGRDFTGNTCNLHLSQQEKAFARDTEDALKESLHETEEFTRKCEEELLYLDHALEKNNLVRIPTVINGSCGPHAIQLAMENALARGVPTLQNFQHAHSMDHIRFQVVNELRTNPVKWEQMWLNALVLPTEIDDPCSYMDFCNRLESPSTYFSEMAFHVVCDLFNIVIGVVNSAGTITWIPGNPVLNAAFGQRFPAILARTEYPNHYYAVVPIGTAFLLAAPIYSEKLANATIDAVDEVATQRVTIDGVDEVQAHDQDPTNTSVTSDLPALREEHEV